MLRGEKTTTMDGELVGTKLSRHEFTVGGFTAPGNLRATALREPESLTMILPDRFLAPSTGNGVQYDKQRNGLALSSRPDTQTGSLYSCIMYCSYLLYSSVVISPLSTPSYANVFL